MDLRRLHVGEWIAALAGLVLLVSLFLPWYGEPNTTAWEALAVNDLLLAVFALFAVALLIVTAIQPAPAVPIFLDALVALAGMVASVLVLSPGRRGLA